MLVKVQYSITYLENGATLLKIAVPGFSKENLEVNFIEDNLYVRGKYEQNDVNFTFIPSELDVSFGMPKNTKIDLVSLEKGILHVLFSKKVPTQAESTRLEIM